MTQFRITFNGLLIRHTFELQCIQKTWLTSFRISSHIGINIQHDLFFIVLHKGFACGLVTICLRVLHPARRYGECCHYKDCNKIDHVLFIYLLSEQIPLSSWGVALFLHRQLSSLTTIRATLFIRVLCQNHFICVFSFSLDTYCIYRLAKSRSVYGPHLPCGYKKRECGPHSTS